MDARAPWAEPVLMTADELLQRPEDGWRYELVSGRLVRMAPTGGEHGLIAGALTGLIHRFVAERDLGTVFAAETGFLISPQEGPDTVLAPDLAFVRRGPDRQARTPGYPRIAPDLVVEVASPSQGRSEMRAKARQWLDAGVRLVWVVLPPAQTVEVFRPGGPPVVLTVEDELSGEDVLPGFTCPVGDLLP